MDSTLEFWLYVLTNTGAVVAGGLLTVLSFLAYRRNSDQPSYRFATIGFGLIVFGTLVDPIYLLRATVDYRLTSAEVLLLQATEDILFTAGLSVLFYAIIKHASSGSPTTDDPASYSEDVDWSQNS